MHGAWSYCQAAELFATRKKTQLEPFKKKEPADAQNKNK